MLSLDDMERMVYEEDYASGDAKTKDFSFLEHAYWAKRSGLTPKEQYSLADHQRAALIAEHIPVTGDPSFITRRNLWPNPSAVGTVGMTDPNVNAINGGTAYSAVYSNDFARAGTTSYKWTWGTAGPNTSDSGPAFNFIGEKGKNYTFSAYVYATSLIGQGLRSWAWQTNDGVFGNNPSTIYSSAGYNNTVGAWFRLSITTPPLIKDGKVAFSVQTDLNLGKDSKFFYVDQILVEEGDTVGSYFAGQNPSLARWAGAANNSVSELSDPKQNTNSDLLLSRMMRLGGGSGSYADLEYNYYKTLLGL